MNPITRMMKRYIKTPLKYALPLLFIGALVLVSTTGCTENASTASVTPTATIAATAKATATPKATVKGTASNTDYSMTAKYQGVYTESNQYMQPSSGNKYVQVYVEVANKNAKDALLGNMFQFKLFDNKNIGYEAATVSANQIQSLQNSNRGDKVAGILVFEIPAGNTPTKLVFEPGLLEPSLTVNL